jgi:cobalt-zinc-cadmium efflux system protein
MSSHHHHSSPPISTGHGHDAHEHGSAFHDHHGHHHAEAAMMGTGSVFAWAAGLNITFIVIEVLTGIWFNSLALLADAGHNFSDVVGLLLAWGAIALARRGPSERYTYGLQSSTILAALANAMLLLVATGIIIWEALHRLFSPTPALGLPIIVVALAGVVVNGFAAWLFMRDKGSKRDVNVRGAYLHMAADAAVSVGVALAGLGIYLTGWTWLDPVASLLIAIVIVAGTWSLLRESVQLALQAVPDRVNAKSVRKYLASLEGVAEVHDLHIWAMSTTSIAMTAHLVMPKGHPGDAFMQRVADELIQHHGIDHPTFQIETSRESCAPHFHSALERAKLTPQHLP